MAEDKPDITQSETSVPTPPSKDDDYYYIRKPPISRRTFLKIGGIAAASSLATILTYKLGMWGNSQPEITPSQSPGQEIPTETEHPALENLPPKDGFIVFAEKDEEVPLSNKRTRWTPDGRIAYRTLPDGRRTYFLSGGIASFMLETDGKKTLAEVLLANEGNMSQVYGPDENVKYRKHYAGITSVLQFDKQNPSHLFGVTHCEERKDPGSSGDYTATIGLIESFDNGKTWEDKGSLVVGDDVVSPGQAEDGGPTGAGQPCAIYNPKDGYVHGLYIDWSDRKIVHPDQIYKFKMKANDDGTLGPVEYYTKDGYSTNFEPEKLKSVIPASGDLGHTALPTVSWNTALNKWVCFGVSGKGFWQSESEDLDNWSEPKLRYDYKDYGASYSPVPTGKRWDYYPTPLSEQYSTSETTGETGILYHSFTEAYEITAHQPMALPFIMQVNS